MTEREFEGKNQDQIEKIQMGLYKALINKLILPVPLIKTDFLEPLFDFIKQIPNIDKHFSDDEINMEIWHFLDTFPKTETITEIEVKGRVDNFIRSFEKEKSCEALIVIPSLIGIPVGTQIGCLKIVDQKSDDPDFVEIKEFQEKNQHYDLDSRVQARVIFKSYKWVNVSKTLYNNLELPFAILSLIFDWDIEARECVGIIKSTDTSSKILLRSQKDIHGWTKFSSRYHGAILESLSEISLDNNPSNLRKKILQAIQVYGLSRLSYKEEIRFIFLIAAFESLLLTDNDRDFLGTKLSEKVAFLLGDNFNKRLEIYKQLKDFYNIRSGLIHSGKSKISNSEVENLGYMFRDLVIKILELSKTYPKMEQKSQANEPEGIEDLIFRIKFT